MLMEHNKEAYEQFKAMLLEHRECLLIAATGIGKSNITTEFIREMNLNVLVVAPLESIRKNWSDMPEKYNIPTEINAVTYQYFYRHWKDLYGFDAYIFDEAHHSGSEVWGGEIKKFREGLNNELIIGLTADPNRYSDNKNKSIIESVFHNHVVYGLNQKDAVNTGVLPKAAYICALFDTEGIFQEYKKKEMTDELRGRLCYTMTNCEAIEVIMRRHIPQDAPLKGIIFVDSINNINTGVRLARRSFPKEAVHYIHSNLSPLENEETLEMFKQSKSGFIVTVDMLNEGLHIDGVNIIIMLRKTQSPSIYTQQIGRGLTAGGQSITIYDLVRNDTSIKKVLARIHNFEFEDGEYNNGDGTKEYNRRISDQTIIMDYATDILSVLDEIDRYEHKNKKWTPEEDKILIENYPTMGKYVSELLPNRTTRACSMRAQVLKLSFKPEWTKEEEELLKIHYPTIGTNVAKMLNKTKSSCQHKAIRMGLTFERSWTPEEDKILIENYPSMGSSCASLLKSRSEVAVLSRAAKLKLEYNRNIWSQEEDNIIMDYYPTMGSKVSTLLNGRTEKACSARAKLLGVQKDMKKWTPDEDKIIIENYPTMGSMVCKLLKGRTAGACKGRASRLGVTQK